MRTKAELGISPVMDKVLERDNLHKAYDRVVGNKGSAGVDGIGFEDFKDYLNKYWHIIRDKLKEGQYIPQAIRKVEIAKPDGGVRILGIPTYIDRFIQQAIHQVLSPIFDPDFSEFSYGFRTGKSAHQAVEQAQQYVQAGYSWLVDIDLEKFFDRVNHDLLMSKLESKVKDKAVLRLIRRFLEAGMMAEGIVSVRTEGTPQGSPLSPLLSNILLSDLDAELERRGHKFCRYADDCNIYVKSEQAGIRVFASLKRFIEIKLKLKVNESKSAVDRPFRRVFLGYSVTRGKPRLKISSQSVSRFKDRIRLKLKKARGRRLDGTVEELNAGIRGWANYFKLIEVSKIREELDGWIRHKLRCIAWRQWKRVFTRAKNLMKHGLTEERAWRSATNQRGAWWNSGASHMNQALPKAYFDKLGLVSIVDTINRLQRI